MLYNDSINNLSSHICDDNKDDMMAFITKRIIVAFATATIATKTTSAATAATKTTAAATAPTAAVAAAATTTELYVKNYNRRDSQLLATRTLQTKFNGLNCT